MRRLVPLLVAIAFAMAAADRVAAAAPETAAPIRAEAARTAA